jgi:peptidoglycan/LPS O-acetylase OafA/YrhL
VITANLDAKNRAQPPAVVEPQGAGPRILALDGLRGVAILLVMICHFTHDWSSTTADRAFYALTQTGGLGVDLFFVLSGFLITGILVDAKGSNHYFRNFYIRRALRILPLYYGLVAALVLLPMLGMFRNGFLTSSVARYQAWYWTHAVNWLIALSGSFAVVPAELGILWSLAIEEQFYFIWPLIVFALSPARLIRVCLGVIAASYLLRMMLCVAGAPPDTISVATFARVDPLAVGALVALLIRSPAAWDRLVAWAPGVVWITAPALIGMAASSLSRGSVGVTLSLAASAPLWGGVLVLTLAASPWGLWHRACTSGFLRQFGKYSYAMYLFHNIVQLRVLAPLGITKRLMPPIQGSFLHVQLLIFTIGVALSFGVAYASWHLYEKHFLRLKQLFPSGHAYDRAVSDADWRHRSRNTEPHTPVTARR